ncbi:hypothetical protein SLEP1_g53275 [Rubroshorea leprosula]|uniref:Uncharacterized protein n=1 Tax=Rubroshorea leprosula TaxID=152421 RepID=A0AAV5M8Y7_9ROSI|nr:hypothetical protein SLEP1_g53275 [Rubroshorea leprosula]
MKFASWENYTPDEDCISRRKKMKLASQKRRTKFASWGITS